MSNSKWGLRKNDFKGDLRFGSTIKRKIIENRPKLETPQDAYAKGVFMVKKAGRANIRS
jgi:hypothetical protein